jgi:hypothetical protein
LNFHNLSFNYKDVSTTFPALAFSMHMNQVLARLLWPRGLLKILAWDLPIGALEARILSMQVERRILAGACWAFAMIKPQIALAGLLALSLHLPTGMFGAL